jgi:glycogen synthase
LRILLLSNLYPPHVEGGAEILAADVAGGLQKLGHELCILTSTYGVAKAQQDGNIWRTLHTAPVAHFNQRRSILSQFNQFLNYYRRYHSPANARELQRLVAALRPDVLYIWEITGIGVTSLLNVLPKIQIPIVFHLGSYWLIYASSPETEQSRLNLRKLKQLLIGTVPALPQSSFIAVSGTVKQKYVDVGFDPEHIEIIYNGIDPRFLDLPKAARKTSRDSTKVPVELLFVGRLRVEKGILVILKALDLLLNAPGSTLAETYALHLNIFGNGDKVYVDELQAFLKEKGLAHMVTFHGRVPQDELIQHYDQSDIMLVPSLWQEPFGLIIAEAMARGVPVIASNLGGPAEILTHDVDGLLVEPGNEQALALAIQQLSEHPEQRQQLVQAAQATVRERFTIARNAQRVEQHLQKAIQKKT